MNYRQLADEILVRFGSASDDGLLDLTSRKSFVSTAIAHLVSDLQDPDWLRKTGTITTAAGIDNYAVPADWSKTISVRLDTDNFHLPYVGFAGLDEEYGAQANDAGFPSAWTQEGGFIYLRPIPAGVYTLTHRYIRAEPDLVADADVPLLPARFHDAITEKACMLAAARMSIFFDRVPHHQAQYVEWLKKMNDEQSRVTVLPRIRIRTGW